MLSDVHRQYLHEHAISDAVIEDQGIRSEGDVIVFTWRHGDEVTEQRRMWPEPEGGLEVKYLWEAGRPLHLNVIRDGDGDKPVLLCEGTKQSLAVASWMPPEYGVTGMAGCRGWANSDLSFLAGKQVIVMLDADAAENLDVYEAGERLAAKLDLEGASPLFARLPSAGKDGIDDYLAGVREDRRTAHLVKLAGDAVSKNVTKPAPRKPTRRSAHPESDRPIVMTDDDRRDVIRQILGAMQLRWSGTELFCYGNVLTRLRDTETEPLGKGAFLRWLSEGVSCFRHGGQGGFMPAWPDKETVEAVMASADEFTALDRVARTPFLRPDGTVCAKNGYDPATRTMLITGNSGMDRLDIPDTPAQADAAAAAGFLLDEWLGPHDDRDGMPFRDVSSRANCLALILTPFVRGLVPLVPLAVVSGLQPGVGKNLLADCMSLMITGKNCVPLPWIPDDDDEIRKQILSAFRAGSPLFCFDEAHLIDSTALSRALTAVTYTDRVLGVSTMASYPNYVTWMALGNHVEVLKDMSRRAYFIELYPEGRDPQDRDESVFAHPDLRGWTLDARPELVTAALVMLRAWFAAGCPAYPRGSSMGSFENWDRMMSGVLGYAGVPGFLGDLRERRVETDYTAGFWHDHLIWAASVFGAEGFTAIQVKTAAIASGGHWESPPGGLDNLQDPGFTRKLGLAYKKAQDRWFGDSRVVRVGTAHGGSARWTIEMQGETVTTVTNSSATPPVSGDSGDDGDSSATYAPTRARTLVLETDNRDSTLGINVFSTVQRDGVVTSVTAVTTPPVPSLALTIDLETGSADDLFTYTDRDERGYVRLAGVIGPAGTPLIMSGPELLPLLDAASVIEGHNLMAFDLVALARHCGADYDRLAAKARDTELVERQANPPRSRETGGALDSYDLDTVAQRLGVPGKTDDMGRLKRVHGGYDTIPLDDPEYRAYLEGDLRATAAVSAEMTRRYPADPYVDREHQLAAIAGRMTLNGFAVNRELLAERLAAGQERKHEALGLLHAGWGLPLTRTVTRGRGGNKTEAEEPVTSPLATDAGRAWLEAMYERYQVPDPPRTAKAGKLALGADELRSLAGDPHCPAELRGMLGLMNLVTGTRTVYQTAADTLCADGRVHPGVSFRQASGRWSVVNPGLTVFGKRGGKHIERDIFLPDPGHVLLSFDLSQVDMRAMAWLSQDHAYRALFAPGKDAHAEIAAQVGLQRQEAKSVGHGWNYGLGAKRMIANGLDPGKVSKFIAGMEQRFPVLIAWRDQIRALGAAGEILQNGFGRRMRCDPARAYTVAPALMGQGGARDIMCESLLRLPRDIWPFLRTMVHDEIVCSVPKEDVLEVAQVVKQAMTWMLDDDLPVLCDMSAGHNWGEVSAK